MNFLFTITEKFTGDVAGVYSSLMPAERRQRFAECGDALHKKQIVAAYMLLCYSLNRVYGEENVRIAFDYGPTGKPYLKDCKGRFFSISHSEEYVLCSVDSHATGADIQKIVSDREECVNLSVSESLIKLMDDGQAAEEKTATEYRICGDYVVAVSGFGVVDARTEEVGFEELISYFEGRTTIGKYLTLNSLSDSFTVDCTPLEMFKRSVILHGDRAAVSYMGRSITYRQLDEYSDVIAARLIAAGAKVGDAVLLSVGPCTEFTVSQFAIMKAGCTYVPVYNRWPLERVNYIIRECKIAIAIFDSQRLFYDCDAQCKITCDNYIGRGASPADVNERENKICYIIYTSGSTGDPKGVMVTKTNLASFSQDKEGSYYHGLVQSQYARVACICPISFDMSVAENTTTLLNGGTVIFAGEEEQYPENFGNFIIANDVEILWATPSKFKMYLQSESCKKALKGIKLVVLAGEVLDIETARLSQEYPFKLYNTYGPTETTIISTYCLADSADEDIPIGRPFANEACYVANTDGSLCEVGERGELLIAGKCVAAGYKNNVLQTRERFLPNPYGGGMIYRTGDVASLEKDGLLHFYGRRDNQVKVHGFRVELEEIESAIDKFTGKKTVVYCHEGRLVAFVESDVGIPDLSGKLKQVLPDYMIPVVIYYIKNFPLNNNGKTDKKALIALTENLAPNEYAAPESAAERLMASCWSKYLNGVRVGVNDDFYRLGGDSIRALRIASELRKSNMEVTMFDIMNCKTIANLIREIEKRRKERVNVVRTFIDLSECAPADAQAALTPYLDYRANFSGLSVQSEYEPLKMHRDILQSTYNCTRAVYRVDGTADKELIIKAVKGLVKQNAAFRTVYCTGSGRCIQYNYDDKWHIPFLRTKDVNKRFLDDNVKVNKDGGKQYLSYIFLAEDSGGRLYIVVVIHWRFFDRESSRIVRNQLAALLNGRKISAAGITDPAEYANLVRKQDFSDWVMQNDIAEAFSHFAQLSGDRKLNDMLRDINCCVYNCRISMNKGIYEQYNGSPLNFIIGVFAGVLRGIFNKNTFPVYVVDQNRNLVNENLVDTVIDFLPLVVTENGYDYYKYIKKVIALKPAGESMIENGQWNTCDGLLPFVNYVSVLDEKDRTDIAIADNARVDVIKDVNKGNDRISCSAFVSEGRLILSLCLPVLSEGALQSAIAKLLGI